MKNKSLKPSPMLKQKLVLASASPRRLSLLEQIGIIPDSVIATDIDETPLKNELPVQMAKRLACAKAAAIDEPNSYILAADTIVACGRRILGKAEDKAQAKAFLNLLSGRRHKVIGGIALITPDGNIKSRVIETVVNFKRLDNTEIEDYIESEEWQDKAGAYGIQGRAAAYVKFIRGSYSNVVGLSLYDTLQMLKSGQQHIDNNTYKEKKTGYSA